jgi:hypothetical protein
VFGFRTLREGAKLGNLLEKAVLASWHGCL